MTLGKWISERRLALDLNQEELAVSIGATGSAVSRWERDIVLPQLGHFRSLCVLFGVTADEALKHVKKSAA